MQIQTIRFPNIVSDVGDGGSKLYYQSQVPLKGEVLSVHVNTSGGAASSAAGSLLIWESGTAQTIFGKNNISGTAGVFTAYPRSRAVTTSNVAINLDSGTVWVPTIITNPVVVEIQNTGSPFNWRIVEVRVRTD